MIRFFRYLADNRHPSSYANRLRMQRFALFREMTEAMGRPLRILDVGGTELFWEQMDFTGQPGVEITLLNLERQAAGHPGFFSVAGDARDLGRFDDDSFDVVFSNSVIEHVGGWEDQQRMALEMRRVGKRIFLQTPNRYFPMEPHFLFPFFQFLPLRWQVFLLMRFRLGWYPRYTDGVQAEAAARSVRLLSSRELQRLFPGARLHRERWMGMVKSYVVMEGDRAAL